MPYSLIKPCFCSGEIDIGYLPFNLVPDIQAVMLNTRLGCAAPCLTSARATGTPLEWPIRFTLTHWAALLPGLGAALAPFAGKAAGVVAESIALQERSVALRSAPIHVAPMLQQLLFGQKRAVVMTSATLAVDESFDYVGERVGVTVDRCRLLPSPFDYPSQAALYLPAHLPEPRQRKSS